MKVKKIKLFYFWRVDQRILASWPETFGELTKIIWRHDQRNVGELVFWRVDQHPKSDLVNVLYCSCESIWKNGYTKVNSTTNSHLTGTYIPRKEQKASILYVLWRYTLFIYIEHEKKNVPVHYISVSYNMVCNKQI